MSEKWPIGVFASIDAGLGVKLEVAKELGVPTIQLHAPAKATRTAGADIDSALARLIGHGRTGMGSLFKVAAFVHSSAGVPPGFER